MAITPAATDSVALVELDDSVIQDRTFQAVRCTDQRTALIDNRPQGIRVESRQRDGSATADFHTAGARDVSGIRAARRLIKLHECIVDDPTGQTARCDNQRPIVDDRFACICIVTRKSPIPGTVEFNVACSRNAARVCVARSLVELQFHC